MAKLNQIIAIEKGIKSRVYGELTDLNKAVQKPELFNGFSKTYQAKDEADEKLPAESKRVQYAVSDVLRTVERLSSELFDVTARKDWTNRTAIADVKIDGQTILPGVPVSYLLFLEKQLNDIHTFVGNLPVLDNSDDWTKDPSSGLFKAEPTQTHRTKKTARAIVLYPATPEHPAQTQMVAEDIIAGFWTQVKQSGAMPKPEKMGMLERIEKLARAVKEAREEANGVTEVKPPEVGQAVFTYILGGN